MSDRLFIKSQTRKFTMTFRLYSLCLLSLMYMSSCANKTSKEVAKTQEVKQEGKPTRVGGDQDEHGCKASAGYTWSEALHKCIRIWEEGVRLNPVDKSGSYTTIATVVLSADTKKAELFIVDEHGGLILTSKIGETSTYLGKDFMLKKEQGIWKLYKVNKLIYTQ